MSTFEVKPSYPSLKQAFLVWLKVAIYSFGGPSNQIAVMHQLIVEEKKWISEKRFLHALNYCMLLPGPEAQQLAIYIGWLLHKVRGGLIAGSLFVLPGFLSILILSMLYTTYQSVNMVQFIFYGIKPAIIAIVLAALIQISQRAIKNKFNFILAIGAFCGIFFLNIPFPIIILSAGLIGFLLNKFYFYRTKELSFDDTDEHDLVTKNRHISSHSFRKLSLTILLWLMIWFLPCVIIIMVFGINNVFTHEAFFFSKAALVTFGGAYAVLSYIAQQAVEYYQWLKPGEMLDGLGMAEATPGPLIQVVQFVGFLAAYRFPEGLNPLLAGIIGSIITTWVTFVPSFLWIFAGAPYIEYFKKKPGLNAALSAITSSVVGVILNLSVWFAINVLFQSVEQAHYFIFRLYLPIWHTFDIGAFFIMIFSIMMTFRYRFGLFAVLFSGALMGSILKMIV